MGNPLSRGQNTVNQSSEECELQGWVTTLKHILEAFQGSRWLAQLFWFLKKLYFLVNDVENVTELVVIQLTMSDSYHWAGIMNQMMKWIKWAYWAKAEKKVRSCDAFSALDEMLARLSSGWMQMYNDVAIFVREYYSFFTNYKLSSTLQGYKWLT